MTVLLCSSFAVQGFVSPSTIVSSSSTISTPRHTSVTTSLVSSYNHRRRRSRSHGYYATTEEKQTSNGSTSVLDKNTTKLEEAAINGDVHVSDAPAPMMIGDFNASAQVIELMDEISRRINEGSTELVENITNVMDEQLTQMPDSAAQELTEYLADLANKIQKAQMEEVQRQMDEFERLFVSPLERVAFSDAPLFELDQKKVQQKNYTVADEALKEDRKLILAGANSTLSKTSRMRTGEIVRNFNVAPMYYSVALLYRWFRKASVCCFPPRRSGFVPM